MSSPRIIRCSIEMELQEFRDFNFNEDDIDDENAEVLAAFAFADMVDSMKLPELEDYTQTKIIEKFS